MLLLTLRRPAALLVLLLLHTAKVCAGAGTEEQREASNDASPFCTTTRLPNGNCVWVFAAADVQDATEMALLQHFVMHYTAMGIPTAHLLLLVHVRQPGGRQEADEAVEWLQRAYGIRHTRVLIEKGERDSPRAFITSVWSFLADIVAREDWVLHVELDEFVVFPKDFDQSPAHGPGALFDIHKFLAIRDYQGDNVVYGYVVDRLAEGGQMAAVAPSTFGETIFEQFPTNCGITYGLRHADLRRCVAYKGYIRADIGHHICLGVSDDFEGNLRIFSKARRLQKELRSGLFEDLFAISPYTADGEMPFLNSWFHFATVFHFKWNSGLRAKAQLASQKGWFPSGSQGSLLSNIDVLEETGSPQMRRILENWCRTPSKELSSAAFSAQETILFNLKMDHEKLSEMLEIREAEQKDMSLADYDRRLVLYRFFHFGFPYNISTFLWMVGKMT
eukprot:TRINITY_DN81643_c0_g1_i1.p1 TRINITY_DN81643_c0_g1~~TRINITY_DN81643_c0_g1_i1.p1  ORF type:complete len:472 (+),score=91.31 TRINITY_DN81643_c0_g1_i1:78-1418(+)